MGREIKRVPLNFSWPVNKIWWGYQRPESLKNTRCMNCSETGYSDYGKNLYDKWNGYVKFDPAEKNSKPFRPDEKDLINLATARLSEGTYTDSPDSRRIWAEAYRIAEMLNSQWSNHLNEEEIDFLWEDLEEMRQFFNEKKPATAFEFNRVMAMNEYRGFGRLFLRKSYLGHHLIEYYCKKNKQRLLCKFCDGHGYIEPEGLSEWNPTPVPEGPGYQMWETVTEGSPQSPVFESPEKLAKWLTDNYKSKTIGQLSYEQWLAFCKAGWAPSAVIDPQKGMMSGVEHIANRETN